MADESSAPVRPGDVLGGKYRVERILGAGGMGVVVLAQHIVLGERVALKFVLPDATRAPGVVERFLREAQAAVRIKSEHIARVSDVGQLDNGAPFMVMEFLEGYDLGQILERRKRLPIELAVGYVLQASEAIAEAHSLGIVHRDLKPANLFLTQRSDGSHLIKVLDFGISKLRTLDPTAPGEVDLTRTSGMLGSPLYMSPEQVRSAKHVDARADIWSIGIILHQLIAGAPPFDAESLSAVFAAIVADLPVPLRRVVPEAPAALERVLLRCLEKDPARRFPDLAEMTEALLPFGPAEAKTSVDRCRRVLRHSGSRPSLELDAPPPAPSVISQSATPVPNTPPKGTAETDAGWDRTTPGLAPVRWGLFAGVGLAVVALGGGAALWGRATSGPHEATPASNAAQLPLPEASRAPTPAELPAAFPPAAASISAVATASAPPATSAPGHSPRTPGPRGSAVPSSPTSPPPPPPSPTPPAPPSQPASPAPGPVNDRHNF